MSLIEAIPESDESMLRMLLVYALEYHMKHNQLETKEKIEFLILKKYFMTTALREIFKNVDITQNHKEETGHNELSMTFKDNLKQYLTSEYNKYIENNDKEIC